MRPTLAYRCGGSAGITPASQFSAVSSGTLQLQHSASKTTLNLENDMVEKIHTA